MNQDQIIAAGVRNYQLRQAQIARLRPRQDIAAAKRAELLERAEACANTETRAEAFARLKWIPNFFPTPPAVAERMIVLAHLRPDLRVLEPSAGKGDLALRIRAAGCAVECVERVHALAELCRADGLTVRCDDFLSMSPTDYGRRFDRVIMNPPFERGACRLHVLHAFEFLAPGGLLVATVSNMTAHRLTDWADDVQHLPAGSFAASERPTLVNTAIIQKTK